MRKFQHDTPRWRAVKEAWVLGVPVRLIAALANLVPRTVETQAERNGWPAHPAGAAPIGAIQAGGDPQGIRANMMAAVSRRFGALSFAEMGDEETTAKAMTALVRTTEAASRLADAFESGEGGRHVAERSDDEVRRSIRRKLQAWLGHAREPERE